MKGKLKNLLPIAIIIAVMAIVIGIIIGVSEAYKPPKDTRIPATVSLYYRTQNEDGKGYGDEQLLCSLTKDMDGETVTVTLPYTGGRYAISWGVTSDPKVKYYSGDILQKHYYYTDEQGNEDKFTEIKKKGCYEMSWGVWFSCDVFIPFSVNVKIFIVEKRAPATITVYYESYDSEKNDWLEKKIIGDITKDGPLLTITVPYTGEEYRLLFEVKADTEEGNEGGNYDKYGYMKPWGWYNGKGEFCGREFSELKEKGRYCYDVGIKEINRCFVSYNRILEFIIE